MGALTNIIAATAAFVGTHFLLSHPLRAPLVARLGPRGFQLLYSLVAFATLGWLIYAAGRVEAEAPLWITPDWLWIAGALLMLLASVLLAGSLFGNPALPAPGAEKLATREPKGVFAITRHPMMWSFAIWGVVHILVWPTPSNIVVGLGIIILALGGSAAQDAKKTRRHGDVWRSWRARTAFVPFTGMAPPAAWWPGSGVLIGGLLLWLAAMWAHIWLNAPVIWVFS